MARLSSVRFFGLSALLLGCTSGCSTTTHNHYTSDKSEGTTDATTDAGKERNRRGAQ